MKKIISLVVIFIFVLSTSVFADPIWGDNMNPQGEAQVNIIGKTNEGWVVAEEDGVVIIPFDNANPNAQNGRSMPSVVGGPGNDPLLDLLFGLGRTMQNQDKPIIDFNSPKNWWEHEKEFE